MYGICNKLPVSEGVFENKSADQYLMSCLFGAEILQREIVATISQVLRRTLR